MNQIFEMLLRTLLGGGGGVVVPPCEFQPFHVAILEGSLVAKTLYFQIITTKRTLFIYKDIVFLVQAE